jgi:four helix bundle protein
MNYSFDFGRRHGTCARKGMRPPLRQEMLNDVLQFVALVRPIVDSVARRDRDLASQIRRATSSVGLNVAEAFGTAAGNARLRFETARGSLYETQAGIRIALAWGYVNEQDIAAPLAASDDLAGRLYGLARR